LACHQDIGQGPENELKLPNMATASSETSVDLVQVGPYVILNRLSKSGRSEVYKARHVDSGLIVALKVIQSERLATPGAVNQLLLEIEALAELEHPNIVQFCDADKTGDTFYCAMEFVVGTDLANVVRKEGPLRPFLAAEYCRQAALGLQCAHEHNLVHRDIKPINLLLTQVSEEARPLIKILDWGLASLRPTFDAAEEPADRSSETKDIGTAGYQSPEQVANPDQADIRGDIYSLGCTLFFLLTGRTPLAAATPTQKDAPETPTDFTDVEKLIPEVPRGLGSIVRRMMAKESGDRFQTPAAAALALWPFCRGNKE
jgi:eukaryotic-like serine/threonine-protein kinase